MESKFKVGDKVKTRYGTEQIITRVEWEVRYSLKESEYTWGDDELTLIEPPVTIEEAYEIFYNYPQMGSKKALKELFDVIKTRGLA